jgi:hypothetical protein
MIPYYFDEALVKLPRVVTMADRSRQLLEIRTESGADIMLVIARAPLGPTETLARCVDGGLEDQRRSLRGFELLSKTEKTYGTVIGIEVRLKFVDKVEGPLFHHEFHGALGASRLGFHGVAPLAHAEECDAWMREVLESLSPRA